MSDIDSAATNNSIFFEGRRLPIDHLSPADFENFVHAALICISDYLGIKITGKPSGTGDGGFDSEGILVSNGKILCVQCKRLRSAITPSQISVELAKVAATSTLENSVIGMHLFICSGGVSKTLKSQLRERSRASLAKIAGEKLATISSNEDLNSLRVRLLAQGFNPHEVAEEYVNNLDNLFVWGLEEFDVALSSKWESVLEVVGRFFKVASYIREFPRASFDRSKYLADHLNFDTPIFPKVSDEPLPDWMRGSSAANPLPVESGSRKFIKSFNDLAEINSGELVIILGDGGVGKSTALKLLRREIIKINPELNLPILISLANYSAGSLERAIHNELGVIYGSWKTLPDNIYLLCDGLNECQSNIIEGFLDELKLLLRRRQIACILSTRGSSRHKTIVLPSNVTYCVQVDNLTPIGVKRLAEYTLKTNCDEFIKKYRSLADASWSPMLWTPFSVNVALSLWESNTNIPDKLSEMLQSLLEARCARNAESAIRSLSNEVVLKIAGSLAFQFLITHQKLECSQLEAGQLIRNAKLQCSDALGVSDITELEILQVLVRHELLTLSPDEHLNFGHQLIAGALAGNLLAQNWKANLNSLENSLADDAWVFATKFIDHGEIPQYLENIFKVDLVLGAKVARELPNCYVKIAEDLLYKAIHPTAPETLRFMGLRALARLGTPDALAKVQEEIAKNNENSYAAQRALSIAGNLDFLRQTLIEVEAQQRFPGKVSGGPMDLWEIAPLPIRIDLARQFLLNYSPTKSVKESLRYVAYERDENDAEIIESYLSAANTPDACQAALYALAEVSPSNAQSFVENALKSEEPLFHKMSIMRFAVQSGIPIDLDFAMNCALSEFKEPGSDEHNTAYKYTNFIEQVINANPLPSHLVTLVEQKLILSSGVTKEKLWIMATKCKSAVISNYAVACIHEWDLYLGAACNYFIEQDDERLIHHDNILNICESHFATVVDWDDWKIWRALSLTIKLQPSPLIAGSLTTAIRTANKVLGAVLQEKTEVLSADEKILLGKGGIELAAIHLDSTIAKLIPAINHVKTFIDEADLISLLNFDCRHYESAKENLANCLSGLNDDLIDLALLESKDQWTQMNGLIASCANNITSTRLNLISNLIFELYTIPAGIHIICQILDSCWSDEVAKMVIKTISEIPVWPQAEQQFFNNFINLVARKITEADQAIINESLESAKTRFAKRVITFWSEIISGNRVGLSRLTSH
ncbi:hypothetical protein [Methylophilus sp. Leaf408]|uniref:hypothetical protein n=1 Tax=Methylophilus sp. Leaf408 TaxID=2876561 RepID=UPI001E369913|nr:hypothetical protein [Methylophilus sp. Leaf408]